MSSKEVRHGENIRALAGKLFAACLDRIGAPFLDGIFQQGSAAFSCQGTRVMIPMFP